MRLIDADAFIEDMKYLYRRAGWGFREIHFSLGDTISNIDNMPTIDTVSVIRCKDCEYRNEYGYCTLYIAWHHLTGDMDYCSDAERKEDDQID